MKIPSEKKQQPVEIINHATHIIGFAGAAQSGKNVSAAYYTMLAWRTHNLVENFEIDGQGKIIIYDLKGFKFPRGKIFDPVTFNNDEETDNILRTCFPHPLNIAQQAALGDSLKEVIHLMFGVDTNLLWGTDKQKAQETAYSANQFISLLGASRFPFKDKKGSDKMTVREILQCFGTEVGRRIDENIWCNRFVERIYRMINQWRPMLILVPDVRFEEEIDTIRQMNGTIIGLTRQIRSSAKKDHASEKIDKIINRCDIVINNDQMSIKEQCLELFPIFSQIVTKT